MAREIIKKITFKGVVGTLSTTEIKEIIKGDGIIPQSMIVLGRCKGLKLIINHDTGEEYPALDGEFIAYPADRPDDVKQSGTLFLPAIAQDLITGQVVAGQVLEFALKIGLRLPRDGERTATGYLYTVTPLVEPSESDPMEKLLAATKQKLLS